VATGGNALKVNTGSKIHVLCFHTEGEYPQKLTVNTAFLPNLGEIPGAASPGTGGETFG
jgi:hypothetical protein